ncbi:MAG: FHA domain-containing protein [Candidatus Latescibacterota bacterium]
MIVCLSCGHPNRNDHLFCTECGRELSERAPVSAELVAMYPSEKGTPFLLSSANVYIGRMAFNDIVIEDDRVSGQHAELSFEEGQFWIEDLGSTNGTYVNGERITRKSPLKNEDLIKIGVAIYKIREC